MGLDSCLPCAASTEVAVPLLRIANLLFRLGFPEIRASHCPYQVLDELGVQMADDSGSSSSDTCESGN